jgi:hypothetical protein
MKHEALSPELQRLINEPLSEPPPRARQLWKALAQAMERLDNARVQQASYDAEVSRLREELTLVRQRDQQRLGAALAAGELEPEPEAPAIEAEIERNVRRSAAMTDQILGAQQRVAELVLRHKEAWAKDLARHLGDAGALYRAAIVTLEQARDALAELVQVGGWLDVFPQTSGQVATGQLAGDDRLVDPLTGHPEPSQVPRRMFSAVLNELRRDSEALPLCGPVQPSREFLRTLERKQLIAERVDGDGIGHPVVLQGDTREGWRARDYVKDLLRP